MNDAAIILGVLEEAIAPDYVLERALGIPWTSDDYIEDKLFLLDFSSEWWYICPTLLCKATRGVPESYSAAPPLMAELIAASEGGPARRRRARLGLHPASAARIPSADIWANSVTQSLRARGIDRTMLLNYTDGNFCINRETMEEGGDWREAKEFLIADPQCAQKIRKYVYAT